MKYTLYNKIYNRLLSDEKKLGVEHEDVGLDIDDVYTLLRHIY